VGVKDRSCDSTIPPPPLAPPTAGRGERRWSHAGEGENGMATAGRGMSWSAMKAF